MLIDAPLHSPRARLPRRLHVQNTQREMMRLQGLHFLKEDKNNQRLIYKSLTVYIGIKKETAAPAMQTCGKALQSYWRE